MSPIRRLAPSPPPVPIVLDRVTVIDVRQGELHPAQRVVIVGNRIRAVGPIATVPIPTGAQVIDARTKYLIPGLWDMHTHSWRANDVYYRLFIANGITGIRDAWSVVPIDTIVLWQREILAGTRIGPPRQLLAGPALDEQVSCTRDRNDSGHLCVRDSADAVHVVDSLQRAGVTMLKTYNLGAQLYFAIAGEARRLHLRFGGHAPAVTAQEASDSGASIVDHIETAGDLDQICLPGSTGGVTARLADCQALAARFRRNDTWWCPTLVSEVDFNGLRLGPVAHALFARFHATASALWKDTIPPSGWLHGAQEDQRPAPSASSGPGTLRQTDTVGFLRFLHQVGFPIVAGTDGAPDVMEKQPPGLSLHTELATYVAEGLTPLEALQAATLNPALLLHATDSLGTVAPGKLADLVLLDANPLTDITNTTRIRAVIANGQYFDRAKLDQLVTVAQYDAK